MARQTTLDRYLTGPDDASFCHRVSEALSRGWVLESRIVSGRLDLKRESVSQTKSRKHDVVRKPLRTFRHHAFGHPTRTFDAAQGRVVCGQAIIKDIDGPYTPDLELSEQ